MTNVWNIASEKLQTSIVKLKASLKTHLEGCFVDIVRELFGNNFVITGGFPAFVNGITDRYTDVNFLLPKCLLDVYGYSRDSQHKRGCQRSKGLEHHISRLVTRALKNFYKTYAYHDGNGDNVSTTTSTRVLNYGLPTSIIVNSTSHDFFPQSMNAHGPMYQLKQRSVRVTRPVAYPTKYLFDEYDHSSVGHQGKYIIYDSGCYTISEGHIYDIREMLVKDDVRLKVKFDENGDIVAERMSDLPRDNPLKIQRCESMCNILNHADFESYWGATIIKVKLSNREHYVFDAEPFRNENDEPRLMTLVFLDYNGLKSDEPVFRTNFKEGGSTCMINECKKNYIYDRLRSRFEDLSSEGRLRKTYEDTFEERSYRQKVFLDKIKSEYGTRCICCIAEECSGSSNDSVAPASSPPIGDLLEKFDVMHEGGVLSFPRVNKTYSDLLLKHIAYNPLVCNASKHAMIPHGEVLYMTYLGNNKYTCNNSTYVSGKEALYAKRCVAVNGNCLSLRETCVNRILWYHSTDTLVS